MRTDAPADLFAFDPTVRSFPVIEIDGIRAIVERGMFCCFYAIDAGEPFPSETGFRSAGMFRTEGVSSEEIFAGIIEEQRKAGKGKLPIPETVYRQPFAGEQKPCAAAGRQIAFEELNASPLNADLIMAAYGADKVGNAWGSGDPEKLAQVTQSILPAGFKAETDADGQGFAVVAPSGLRLPAKGFFPAIHNLRAHLASTLRDATRKTLPALFPTRRKARAAAPAPLLSAERA